MPATALLTVSRASGERRSDSFSRRSWTVAVRLPIHVSIARRFSSFVRKLVTQTARLHPRKSSSPARSRIIRTSSATEKNWRLTPVLPTSQRIGLWKSAATANARRKGSAHLTAQATARTKNAIQTPVYNRSMRKRRRPSVRAESSVRNGSGMAMDLLFTRCFPLVCPPKSKIGGGASEKYPKKNRRRGGSSCNPWKNEKQRYPEHIEACVM